MKVTILKPTEVDVKFVEIHIPVYEDTIERYIANKLPFLNGRIWTATIDIDTGVILNWPKGLVFRRIGDKVRDEGMYILRDRDFKEVARIHKDYVPNDLIPGDYGDYVELRDIDENGKIGNWPKKPCVNEFFTKSGQ